MKVIRVLQGLMAVTVFGIIQAQDQHATVRALRYGYPVGLQRPSLTQRIKSYFNYVKNYFSSKPIAPTSPIASQRFASKSLAPRRPITKESRDKALKERNDAWEKYWSTTGDERLEALNKYIEKSRKYDEINKEYLDLGEPQRLMQELEQKRILYKW